MSLTVDVIIAGAGPAGSSLACRLAGRGLRVILVDKAEFPRDKVCGDFVSPRGLELVDELGASESVRAAGSQAIRGSRLYLNAELLVEGTLPALSPARDHGLVIPRYALDHALVRRAIDAGAVLREGWRFRSASYLRGTVEAIFDAGGREERVRARFLVGADGAHSAVARWSGLRDRLDSEAMVSMRCYARNIPLQRTIMYFDRDFFPGYAWVFPIRDGRANVGVGMPKRCLRRELTMRGFFDLLVRLVHRLGRALGREPELEREAGWSIVAYGGRASRLFPGGLLIGEAGGFVDPINGEGIPLALETASMAADVLQRALDSGSPADGLLSEYDAAWRRRLAPDLDVSNLVVTLLTNLDLKPVWLHMLKLTSKTARADPRYARVAGGVLGGVVPAREALGLGMFAATTRQALSSPPSVAELSMLLSSMGRAMRNSAKDPSWLRDVVMKQARVTRSLMD